MNVTIDYTRPQKPEPVPEDAGGRLLLSSGGGSPFGRSRAARFERCPRLYAFTASGWIVDDRDVLLLGSLIHAGHAHHYAAQGARQGGCWVTSGFMLTDPEMIWTPHEAIQKLAEQTNALKLVDDAIEYTDGYLAFYGPKDVRNRVLAVEWPVQIDFFGRPYSSVFDLVWRLEGSGEVQIVDAKSSSTGTVAAALDYQMSSQMLGMWHLGKSVWPELGSIAVALIPKKTDGTPIRQTLHLSPHDVAAYPQRAVWVLHMIEETTRIFGPPDPWKWPARYSGGEGEGCRNKYGACPMLTVCQKGPRSSEAILRAPPGWVMPDATRV